MLSYHKMQQYDIIVILATGGIIPRAGLAGETNPTARLLKPGAMCGVMVLLKKPLPRALG
jgi:hypothetical protein